MSKTTTTTICQSLLTLSQDIVRPFIVQLNSHPQLTQTKLTLQQLALVAAIWPTDQSLVIIVDDSRREAERVLQQIVGWQALFSHTTPWHLISNSLSEQEAAGTITTDLSLAYHQFLSRERLANFVVLASQIEQGAPDPSTYHKQTLAVQIGQSMTIHSLIERLVNLGYTRFETTLEPGGIRVQGERIDIWHPIWSGHYSITFFGQTIESIIHRQERRSTVLNQVRIPPVALASSTVPLSELFIRQIILRPNQVTANNSQHQIIYDSLTPNITLPLTDQTESHHPLSTEQPLTVLYQNLDRVQAYVRDHELVATDLARSLLATIPLHLTTPSAAIVTEAWLFPNQETTPTKPISYDAGLALLVELQVGKPAVHADHGIGIYEGLQSRTIGHTPQEYLVLRYAAGDTLSVPVEYAHKVTAYLGEEHPKLHRLGGTLWQASKKQAQQEAENLAAELLEIASKRHNQPGEPYYLDSALEQQLTTTFPYPLTPDQEQAWEAVKSDLSRSEPMDRLIVGDVGFGKTEIAIRAAAHVAATGKQVAVLAPTTLLAQQHADTFKERLKDIKSTISVLSRFSTPAEQQVARQHIKEGSTKIAIGTHALLSKSTQWHDLGLVIIDEEQRFGVKHKEHFKKLRATVDILSLSATPIPRTLSMALSGLKQLSIISTPPQGRKSVESYVGPDNDEKLAEALARELNRGGQIYVVSPTIRGLASLARHIQQLAPQASVAVAHGQMPSGQLAKIMERFDTEQLDILVSSTIIENGLDLPNANTLIVTHATRYGLAELYQLRGRVGRRERQGYAYFFYNQHDLTSMQRQRLTALTEASRLGSGWLLAQRDLEIRGAGALLGAEQSGSVNSMGIQLYLDMVQDAMHKAEATTVDRQSVDIHVPLSATLPDHYIADSEERTKHYQRLARARSVSDLDTYIQKLTEQYGPLPAEAQHLHLLLRLQHTAAKLGITSISSQPITPPDEDPYERLIIKGLNLPQLLIKLESLGNWVVRDNALTLDVDAITPQLLDKLYLLGA